MVDICVVDPARHDLIVGCSEVFQSSGKTCYSAERTRFMATMGVMSCGRHEGRVVAVVSTELWQSTDTYEWNKKMSIERISTDPPALFVGEVAVIPAFRRKGIGTRLIKQVILDSRYDEGKQPFTRVFAVSRKPVEATSQSSFGVLRKLGFVELARVIGYFNDPAWDCPSCGKNCSCDGRLMYWIRTN